MPRSLMGSIGDYETLFTRTCSNCLVVDFVQDLAGDHAALLRRKVLHNLIYMYIYIHINCQHEVLVA